MIIVKICVRRDVIVEGLSTMELSLLVIFSGITIVFGVLVALTFIISLFGKFIKPDPVVVPKAAAPAAAQSGVSPQVVAAISAAVSVVCGDDAKISSVKKSDGGSK